MKKILVLVFIMATAAILGCSDRSKESASMETDIVPLPDLPAVAQPEEPNVENPVLRRELIAMEQRDQAVRDALVQKGLENVTEEEQNLQNSVDSANTGRLKEIIAEYGWPTKALVGDDGARAAFLIVQHSDLTFQKEILPSVQKARESGQINGESFALLYDRILVREGKPQKYGTQAQVLNGEIVFETMEDEENIDELRRELGMMPLDQYRKILEELYGLKDHGLLVRDAR